jgi:hypothetical protein
MKLLPIQHALVLHRVDPDRHVARFDSQMIKRDLFGTGGFGSAEAVLGGGRREVSVVMDAGFRGSALC